MDMQLSRSLNLHLIWKSLGLAVNLVTTILIARLLGASVSGQFFYFLSWMSLLVLISSVSLDSSITYFLASKEISKQSLSAISLLWIFFVTVVLSLIGVAAGYKIEFIQSLPADGVMLGLFFIAGQLMINLFTAFFYGEHKFIMPAKILFYTGVVYVFFLIFCMSNENIHNDTIIKSYIYVVFTQGLLMMMAILFSKDFKPLSLVVDIAVCKRLLVYSGLAFSANILFFLATRVDYWMLNHYHEDPVSIGNYIQVSRLVQLFQLMPAMLAAFIFPVAAARKEKIWPYLALLCRLIILLDIICVVIIGLFGKYLFPFIFGNSFLQMHELFLLLMPGIFSLSVLAIFSAYFAGINKVHINMSGAFFGLIVISILNYIFIPFYHVKAAAIVSSVGYTVCMLYAFFYIKKTFNFRIHELFMINKEDINTIKKLIANK